MSQRVWDDGRHGTGAVVLLSLEAFKESENSKRQRQRFTQSLRASVEHTKWFH